MNHKIKRFHDYVEKIKQNIHINLYNAINPTLSKNQFISNFPNAFLFNDTAKKNRGAATSFLVYYFNNFYKFISYGVMFVLFKFYYKRQVISTDNKIVLDVFVLVDNVIQNGRFDENYFKELYPILEQKSTEYIIIPRVYGANKNPLKLIKLFKILNKDNRQFLFEFQLLGLRNYFELLCHILIYPFKALDLKQKVNQEQDEIFNRSLIHDISQTSFDAFTRYQFGKNIALRTDIKRVYSWCEFQVVEKGFNFGLRTFNPNIEIIGCQFSLVYTSSFNMHVTDVDFETKSSPTSVLVNGIYNILECKKIQYRPGVSLRYKELFNYKKKVSSNNYTLILGSIFEEDIERIFNVSRGLKNQVLFKSHPAFSMNKINRYLTKNIEITNKNIYELFNETEVIIVAPASGTAVEAVSCGISVILIASEKNLTANPLVEKGKGEIWDIVHNEEEMVDVYNKLIVFRQSEKERIVELSTWYRDSFFIEPNDKNIIKAFDL